MAEVPGGAEDDEDAAAEATGLWWGAPPITAICIAAAAAELADVPPLHAAAPSSSSTPDSRPLAPRDAPGGRPMRCGYSSFSTRTSLLPKAACASSCSWRRLRTSWPRPPFSGRRFMMRRSAADLSREKCVDPCVRERNGENGDVRG
jgi:hypothetical protein